MRRDYSRNLIETGIAREKAGEPKKTLAQAQYFPYIVRSLVKRITGKASNS
jgi:hypothetical protein